MDASHSCRSRASVACCSGSIVPVDLSAPNTGPRHPHEHSTCMPPSPSSWIVGCSTASSPRARVSRPVIARARAPRGRPLACPLDIPCISPHDQGGRRDGARHRGPSPLPGEAQGSPGPGIGGRHPARPRPLLDRRAVHRGERTRIRTTRAAGWRSPLRAPHPPVGKADARGYGTACKGPSYPAHADRRPACWRGNPVSYRRSLKPNPGVGVLRSPSTALNNPRASAC
jgi:hypothetical protein